MKYWMICFRFAVTFSLLPELWSLSTNGQLRNRILEKEEIGTFLIADIQYNEQSIKGMAFTAKEIRPDQSINIEFEDGHIYSLTNINPSWLKNNSKRLKSGKSRIRIAKGTKISKSSIVASNIAVESNTERELEVVEGNQNLGISGNRTVLAVRVVASDGQYTFSEDTLEDKVFGTLGDSVNLVSQFAACSYNQLRFVKAADRNGTGTFIRNGVVTITVHTSVFEGDSVMRNDITDEINRAFGVSNPNEIADHVMYCLPSEAMSSIAYAFVNSWNSVYNNEWCNYVSAQMHEIGHNLGFAHSNDVSEAYGDRSCMMGYSYEDDNGPLMCFNSAKSYQSAWYSTKVISPTLSDCGTFDGKIFGVSDYDGNITGNRTIVIKINDSRSGAVDFYVNYNKQTGINSGTLEEGNQVMITSAGNEGVSYSSSTRLSMLAVGETFAITNFEDKGKNVLIHFHSVDTTENPSAALLWLSYDGFTCGITSSRPSPRPTPTPSSRVPFQPKVSKIPTPATSFLPSKKPIITAAYGPISSSPMIKSLVPKPVEKLSQKPATVSPSLKPTAKPTQKPVTSSPSMNPTAKTTQKPINSLSMKLTAKPTQKPATSPSMKPTDKPKQKSATSSPTTKPTQKPNFLCSQFSSSCSNKYQCCSRVCNKRRGVCE